MITVSKAVIADFDSHFQENEMQDIRIYLAPGDDIHRLALVLDHAQEEDSTCEIDGYRFCFQKDLLKKCGGINIDLNDMGFVVEPVIPFVKRSASCGSSCGSCKSNCSSSN